jgi:hypothetical protein
MSSNFEMFKKQIDEAIGAIEQAQVIENQDFSGLQAVGSLVDTQSLLARCDVVCNSNEADKPTIRIIHHLACSGGTLISKCLSAMPNVFLLSEVHPSTELHIGSIDPKYMPSDIASLAKYSGIPKYKDLANQIFLNSVISANKHVEKFGGVLILRDHTHADFCLGEKNSDSPALVDLLTPHFDVKSLLTIRDPIDAYISLEKNEWLHFEPKTFDEYCSRVKSLIKCYHNIDLIKYEEFVLSPESCMKAICESLAIEYSDLFLNIYDQFKMTGDSGRKSFIISERSRPHLSEEFKAQVGNSDNYKNIKEILDY